MITSDITSDIPEYSLRYPDPFFFRSDFLDRVTQVTRIRAYPAR